jgi:hypothetical protein
MVYMGPHVSRVGKRTCADIGSVLISTTRSVPASAQAAKKARLIARPSQLQCTTYRGALQPFVGQATSYGTASLVPQHPLLGRDSQRAPVEHAVSRSVYQRPRSAGIDICPQCIPRIAPAARRPRQRKAHRPSPPHTHVSFDPYAPCIGARGRSTRSYRPHQPPPIAPPVHINRT